MDVFLETPSLFVCCADVVIVTYWDVASSATVIVDFVGLLCPFVKGEVIIANYSWEC